MPVPPDPSAKTSMQGLLPAVRHIVLDALSKGVGGTLTRSSDFQKSIGVGAGTIQRAITLLANQGAISTISRGHLGRTITEINVGTAWHLAQLAPLRIVLSPEGTIEVDAIQATLRDELSALNIPHSIQPMAGGEPRLQGTINGIYDLTVVSAGTLEKFTSEQDHSARVLSKILEPGTYYRKDRLVTVTRKTSSTEPVAQMQRIAIDTSSYDHHSLTTAEFPPEHYTYVDIPYPQIPAYVLAGHVDAGVWRTTKSPIPFELAGLETSELTQPRAQEILNNFSRAAIVTHSNRSEIAAILDSLHMSALVEVQDQADLKVREFEQLIFEISQQSAHSRH